MAGFPTCPQPQIKWAPPQNGPLPKNQKKKKNSLKAKTLENINNKEDLKADIHGSP